MGYKKDFSVKIVRASLAKAQRGFGTILILSNEQEQDVKNYVELRNVVEDFTEETKTYQLAKDLFAEGVDEILITGVAPEGNLIDKLNDTVAKNDSFFGLVATDNDDATITSISGWIAEQEKIYAVTSQSKTVKNTSDQVLLAYHPTDNLAEKGLAYMLTEDIGTVDLDGKALEGITPSDITEQEYQVLKDNNVNVALEKFNYLVIDGGDMAGGEKADVVLGKFWIQIRMEEDLAKLKRDTPKIPFTDQGVALLIDVVSTRLQMAANKGIIAFDANDQPEYEIAYLPITDVPVAERDDRNYGYVEWEARLAGAIRTGVIKGVLTV